MEAAPAVPKALSVKVVQFTVSALWYVLWGFAGIYLVMLLAGYGISGDLKYSQKSDTVSHFLGDGTSARPDYKAEKGIWSQLIGDATWISTKHLFFCLFSLWVLFQFRRLGKIIAAGTPFVIETPKRIRLLAYSFFVWEPFSFVVSILLRLIDKHLAGIDTANFSFSLSGGPLFYGLAILVLAHIFDLGVKLQNEQNLTV
ncbi:MAG: DUF2975 domain-containing protein [Candidatus Latescibacteria bacterium]|nr:DUF2975 domain-containing protein [Candidatus Latescibacterota bacterium]